MSHMHERACPQANPAEGLRTRSQVEAALRRQEGLVPLRLGEVLLADGLVSREQLDRVLALQAARPGLPVGEILIRMGALDHATLGRALLLRLGIPCVDLLRFCAEPVELAAPHQEFMRRHRMAPLFRAGTRLVVAVANPLERAPLRELAFCTGLRIDAVQAPARELAQALRTEPPTAEAGDRIVELVSELGAEQPEAPPAEPDAGDAHADNAVVRLVNMTILDAVEQGASDIHVEAMKVRPVRIRFRKDGLLFHYADIPARFREAFVSRIKIMSQLDISERRHAQDGKLYVERFGPARVELRVVTIPTADGMEDIVMRILASRKAVRLHEIGLAPELQAALEELVARPQGLLFVCGPTGSGKTTTLHALIGRINTPERKIWTVEDPIEIAQEGLRQVQVQARIGWTFAAVLRSFMRADPDVIMVGETRDPETAHTVIEASLTGHLVLSTMHTNSAAESMVRLLDLGLDPFNFADALLGVLAQRLVRRLCDSCSHPCPAPDEEIGRLLREYCQGSSLDPASVKARWRQRYGDAGGRLGLRAAAGCPRCVHTGYQGQLGLHELLPATPAIRQLVSARAPAAELARAAAAQGMRSLRQDGIEKILQGLTDWAQVRAL